MEIIFISTLHPRVKVKTSEMLKDGKLNVATSTPEYVNITILFSTQK